MSTYKNLRTPIIKPRTQGGTFYTFASALEDIGLNINELRNKVAISHYALLDIPKFNSEFDTLSRTSFTDVNVGDYRFAEGFENYVLNMEAVVRNQDTYNFAESRTVSERIFWKWLQKSCMSMQVDSSNSDYYLDSNQIVKGFGQITAGSQRSDSYGLYNETFVQIPSSYGQMKCLFKKVEDNNYYSRTDGYYAKDSSGYLENLDPSEISWDDKLFTGISAKAIYDTYPVGTEPGSYTVSSNDTLCLELDIEKLRSYYGDQTLTFDDLAIDEGYDFYHNTSYKFNAVLVYYSIYDSTNKNILATNAYGVLVLDSAQTDSTLTTNFIFPELIKTKSTSTTSGTSYSFRLNIKTSSIYSGDTAVTDNATAAYSMSEDFNDVIRNLNSAIDIMKSNANYLQTISSENNSIRELAVSAVDEVNRIRNDINLVKNGLFKSIDSSVITGDTASFSFMIPDTSFGDASTYYGGFHNDEFEYDNIHTDSLVVDSSAYIPVVRTDQMIIPSGTCFVSDANNNIYAKVSGSGIFSESDVYSYNVPKLTGVSVDASATAELLGKINIYFDSSHNTFTTEFPNESQLTYPAAKAMLKNLYVDSSVTGDTRQYLNLNNIVLLYSAYFKYTSDSSVNLQSIYDRLAVLEAKEPDSIPDSFINALN